MIIFIRFRTIYSRNEQMEEVKSSDRQFYECQISPGPTRKRRTARCRFCGNSIESIRFTIVLPSRRGDDEGFKVHYHVACTVKEVPEFAAQVIALYESAELIPGATDCLGADAIRALDTELKSLCESIADEEEDEE